MSQKQATPAVVSAGLVRGPESCIVTQHMGKVKTEGNLWISKQDSLNTVKNIYGSNVSLVKILFAADCFLLHTEWIKMHSHPL